MKTLNVTLALSLLGAALSATLFFAGCGGGSNPVPPQPDASHAPDTGADRNVGKETGRDSPTSDVVTEHNATDGGGDVNVPDVNLDTGSCKSTTSACNSCYTDAQAAADPLNACSSYTKNCVPFTGTVPTHPSL